MTVKINKTNAARLLDKAKIAYELVPYEVDENNLAATHVAEQLGENIAQVFKTLVLRGDKNGLFVCVVPGDAEVDLKLAAKVSGNKSAAMIHMKELLPATGYIRGGCSPVGMKKALPTFIHTTCMDFGYIYISAGMRGLQIRIAPADLVEFTRAEVTDLILKGITLAGNHRSLSDMDFGDYPSADAGGAGIGVFQPFHVAFSRCTGISGSTRR